LAGAADDDDLAGRDAQPPDLLPQFNGQAGKWVEAGFCGRGHRVAGAASGFDVERGEENLKGEIGSR
jgi:hypothetical protein